MDKISHDDNIGHLFMVDIKFNNVTPKTLLFNQIYSPIFEKNKKMDLYELSALELMSIVVSNEDKEKINSLLYTSKTHSTLKEKMFIQDLYFFDNSCRLACHTYLRTFHCWAVQIQKIFRCN